MMKSKYLKYICVSAVATLLAVMASACGKKEPGSDTRPEKFDNVVLVYAASANNLYSNLHADKRLKDWKKPIPRRPDCSCSKPHSKAQKAAAG